MEDSSLNEIKELLDNKEEAVSQKKKRAVKKAAVKEESYYAEQVKIKVYRMGEDVQIPAYSKTGDACMDVRVRNFYFVKNDKGIEMPVQGESVKLFAGWSAQIGTGLRFEMPLGWAMDIKSRSGLAIKNQVVVVNTPGKLDCNYTGELMIGVLKVSGAPIEIKIGDRIAQIEPVKQTEIIFEETSSIEENKDRGSGGIGHTGVE